MNGLLVIFGGIFILIKKKISWINKIDQKKLIGIFKIFLEKECSNFFNWQKNIVTSKNINIKLFKYENYNENIKKIKIILDLNKEKEILSVKNIRFKKLKINKKKLLRVQNFFLKIITKKKLYLQNIKINFMIFFIAVMVIIKHKVTFF